MKQISVVMVITPFVFFGCGPKTVTTTTKMYQLFNTDFRGFAVPEISEIKQGQGKSFSYAEFDEVWDSAIIVLIQQGILVRSSKNSGTIAAIGTVPLSVVIQRGRLVNVYVKVMDDLYKTLDNPDKAVWEFDPNQLEAIYTDFFSKLATQVYAGKKWRYLTLAPTPATKVHAQASKEAPIKNAVPMSEIVKYKPHPAMISREASEYFIPVWPIATPSQTAIVLNSNGVPPAARTAFLTALATLSRWTWPGTISLKLLAIPINGLPISSAVSPQA